MAVPPLFSFKNSQQNREVLKEEVSTKRKQVKTKFSGRNVETERRLENVEEWQLQNLLEHKHLLLPQCIK